MLTWVFIRYASCVAGNGERERGEGEKDNKLVHCDHGESTKLSRA